VTRQWCAVLSQQNSWGWAVGLGRGARGASHMRACAAAGQQQGARAHSPPCT
jgi:hypothetical protein